MKLSKQGQLRYFFSTAVVAAGKPKGIPLWLVPYKQTVKLIKQAESSGPLITNIKVSAHHAASGLFPELFHNNRFDYQRA